MEPPLPADLSLADYGRPPDVSDDPHPPASGTLRSDYDAGFAVTADYQASLPDLQSQVNEIDRRTAVPIQQVGIAGFELPLQYQVTEPSKCPDLSGGSNGADHGVEVSARQAKTVALKTHVSGTVSLDAHLRAINMSRIIRTFYEFQEEIFTLDTLPKVLARFHETVGSRRGRLRLDFSFPMLRQSLRSGLAGYQYYGSGY